MAFVRDAYIQEVTRPIVSYETRLQRLHMGEAALRGVTVETRPLPPVGPQFLEAVVADVDALNQDLDRVGKEKETLPCYKFTTEAPQNGAKGGLLVYSFRTSDSGARQQIAQLVPEGADKYTLTEYRTMYQGGWPVLETIGSQSLDAQTTATTLAHKIHQNTELSDLLALRALYQREFAR